MPSPNRLSNSLDQLNPEQKQAVLHGSGPAMVLAGAGSGKTRVLTTRAAWLLDQGVSPEEILLVTFTNKAAGEIRSRILELTGLKLPWSGTFHSLSARMLRRHGHLIGLPNTYTIYDTDDQVALIKQLYKEHGFSTKQHNPKAVLYTISDAKNQMIRWEEYQEVASGQFQEHVARVYKLYQHALAKNEAVDFDDLLLRTLDLLTTTPVLSRYQSQLKHVLVDEYQDTNKAQYELTKLLAAPNEDLYVVGDFSQSIYAWRGADYRNMKSLATDFPSLKEYRLERNYRSTQTILTAATQVVSQNQEHPVLSLWTDRTEFVENQPLPVHETRSQQHEAETVLSQIRQLQPEYMFQDVAILYRTNAQSRAFEEAFVKAGVPYQVVGGTKFYERKEVKDVLSYLRTFVNPQDSISWQRAEKLGKRRFQAVQNWKEKYLKQHKLNLEDVPNQEPGPVLEGLLTASTYLEKYDPKDPEHLSRIENVRELLAVAHQFQTILQFLENVALVQNDQLLDGATGEDASNQVTLMSLHAAKGLEFPVVFMVGMEDGLLPHSRSLMDKSQMEEERRLCYVGITRAKDKLFFTYARQRFSYQGTTYGLRSRFLSLIDDSLLSLKGSVGTLYESDSSFSSQSGRRSSAPAKTSNSGRRVVPIDDDSLDDVLNGDLDIEAFLDL